MRREWDPEDLIACWTLVDEDWGLVGNKTGATRLGFALLLKYFELDARFPRHAGEVPRAAVGYVAEQVKVDPGRFAEYAWSGRTIEYHRAQIREALGFRETTREDEERLTAWLAQEVCPAELSDERLREAVLARCRADRIEPAGRVDRILGSARASFERGFTRAITGRVSGPPTIREARANQSAFRRRVRTVLRSSYWGHFRRLLAPLLATLEFRSNNSEYRPVMDAIDLLRRYAGRPGYNAEERVPIDASVSEGGRLRPRLCTKAGFGHRGQDALRRAGRSAATRFM